MNEENLNGGLTPPVVSPENTVPTPAPAAPAPAEMPAPAAPAPVVPETPVPAPAVAPEVPVSAPISEVPAPAPVAPEAPAAPAPVPAPAPVVETPVAPEMPAAVPVQPVPEPVAPTPVEVQPAPVAPAPAPAPVPAPVEVPVATMPEMPAAPVTAAPITNDGFGSAPQPVAPAPDMGTPIQPTIAPTAPLADGVGFVSTGQPVEKKSKKGLVIGIVIAVVALLAVLGIFVIYPTVMKALATPQKVFSETISSLSKEINNTVNTVVHDKGIYSLEFDIDSNIDGIKEFGGYTYSGSFGVDPDNKLLELGVSIYEKDGIEYSMKQYVKDGKQYQRYSTNENLLYTGLVPEDSSINQLFEMMNTKEGTINTEKANYVVNKLSDIFINSLDETKLTKENANVVVNGETIKATRNKYLIDKDNAVRTVKYFAEEIKNDEELLEILAEMNEQEVEDLKEELQSVIDKEAEDTDEEEDNSTIEISIYTYGTKSEFVGADMVMNFTDEETKVEYFTKDGSFNVFYYDKVEFDGESTETSYRINGVNNGGVTEVSFKDGDDKEYFTLEIKEVDGGYSVDYKLLEALTGTEETISGNVTWTTKSTDKKTDETLKFSVNSGDDYFKVNVKITNDWTSDVANINTSAVSSPTEEELQVIAQGWVTEISEKTPVGILIQLMNTMGSLGGSMGYEDDYDTDWDTDFNDDLAAEPEVDYEWDDEF